MANKIPLSVSSNLSFIQSATAGLNGSTGSISAGTHVNNGATGSSAPILIDVEADRTIDADTFALAMIDKGGQGTDAQARLVINAMYDVLNDLIEEYGAITVNTPFGRIETYIEGSLENATDSVGEDNVAALTIIPDAAIMRVFAKMEAYVPASACPGVLRRIKDVATGKAGEIHGNGAFYAQGDKLTYGADGEKVELYSEDGATKKCDVAVDAATKSEAQLKCSLSQGAVTELGKYILRVTTKAGTDNLWPLDLKVNVTELPRDPLAPVITSLSCAGSEAGKASAGGAITIAGSNLGSAEATGYEIEFGLKRSGDWVQELGLTDHMATWTDNTITFAEGLVDLTSSEVTLTDGDVAVFRVTREGHGYAEASRVVRGA